MAEAHPLPELPEGQDTIEHHLAYLKLAFIAEHYAALAQ